MTFNDARFIKSAPDLSHCPDDGLPEIAMAGRSNVGKSSLINSLTQRKKLAQTSGNPGKTRMLNYFLIEKRFYLVDLPGYGFAKVSKKERSRWGKVIQEWFLNRTNLTLTILLIDSRHEATALDRDMMVWLAEHNIPFALALTKCDKLSNNKQQQALQKIKSLQNAMNIEVPVVLCSAMTRRGIEELTDLINEFSYRDGQLHN